MFVILTIVIVLTTLLMYRVLGSVIANAVRSGQWSMNGAVFDRVDRPLMYYAAILTFSFFLLLMTAASYAAITILIDR